MKIYVSVTVSSSVEMRFQSESTLRIRISIIPGNNILVFSQSFIAYTNKKREGHLISTWKQFSLLEIELITKMLPSSIAKSLLKNTQLGQLYNCGSKFCRNVNTCPIKTLPRRFNDKVAIVTASSYGVGRSMAKRLYLEGANVVICSRKQENVDRAVKDIEQSCQAQLSAINAKNTVSGIVCHVGNPEHRKNLVDFTIQKYGQIDCFVSNAAVNPHVGPTESITEKQIDKIFDTNYKAVVFLVQLLLPHLRQSGLRAKDRLNTSEHNDREGASGTGGSVVFISTVAADLGLANLGAYASSKAALITLSRVLARECVKDNIRVNCIAPGPLETKFGSILKDDPRFGKIGDATMMKRFGQEDELDGIVAYLLSDEASYVTGETFNVSGGMR